MTHTKGPWAVFAWGEPRQLGVHQDISRGAAVVGKIIASVENDAGFDAREEEVANARLIAAAPDLLAALKRVVEDYCSDSAEMWQQAQAAIAKAEGGTP